MRRLLPMIAALVAALLLLPPASAGADRLPASAQASALIRTRPQLAAPSATLLVAGRQVGTVPLAVARAVPTAGSPLSPHSVLGATSLVVLVAAVLGAAAFAIRRRHPGPART